MTVSEILSASGSLIESHIQQANVESVLLRWFVGIGSDEVWIRMLISHWCCILWVPKFAVTLIQLSLHPALEAFPYFCIKIPAAGLMILSGDIPKFLEIPLWYPDFVMWPDCPCPWVPPSASSECLAFQVSPWQMHSKAQLCG